MLFKYFKFLFFFWISIVLYYITVRFNLPKDLSYYFILPLSFIFLNYAFFKLILWYIKYYNNLLILHKEQLIVIKSSFLDMDDVEVVDLHKVTKIDWYCRGIIPNLLWYGTLVIEQQRDKVRDFWFIPNVHRAMNYLKEIKVNLK